MGERDWMTDQQKTIALMTISAIAGVAVGAYYMLDRVTRMFSHLATEDPVLNAALKRHGL